MFLQLGSLLAALLFALPAVADTKEDANLLGLPALKVPANNPITPERVTLGQRLYNDTRFSSTGKISCATCHEPNKGFTDRLAVSKGVNGLTGTRSSPTVANAAFSTTQFWDGRSPDLEDQALHPFTNPVEMGLANHEPILKTIREDKAYVDAFKKTFNLEPNDIKIQHVTQAIATFERTQLFGGSKFDRWYYGGENTLNAAEKRGFQAFIGNGRCVSCHVIEQTQALFTDNKFHNIGVGINKMKQADIDRLSKEYLRAQYDQNEVDKKALTDEKSSELGRFAVTRYIFEMGGFKTPTLRNIDLTAPYMHDGSLKTLDEVVEHYNLGGASNPKEVINPYLSGGIRPLNLTAQEKKDLVAFMKALSSPKLVAKK
ncbi:MAG: hypothetical protein KF799_06840 [Bdellovibrionales bacterium]|nr:hypothetical protein [Bdellovibrionales bacterium]